MNWFKKWIAKSALDAAAEKAKELATVENLSAFTADGMTRLLGSLNSETLSDEKRQKICSAIKYVSGICSALADALQDGTVTAEEVREVLTMVSNTFAVSPVTDATLADYVDKAVKAVKERL